MAVTARDTDTDPLRDRVTVDARDADTNPLRDRVTVTERDRETDALSELVAPPAARVRDGDVDIEGHAPAHAVQDVAPLLEVKPGGHGVHAVLRTPEVNGLFGWYVPGGHGKQLAGPTPPSRSL